MNLTWADEFFEAANSLRRPDEMRRLLATLPADSPQLYDLTFHAAFASRLFTILKREGTEVQGFERMQQSLADSVETIRTLLQSIESEREVDLGLSGTGATSSFGGLVEDLAKLKAWMLERTQSS